MKKRLWVAFVVLMGLVRGAASAEEAGAPIAVSFDTAHGFAFPAGILGVQEEVFTIPYLRNDHMEDYRRLGLTAFRYPCGTPSDWLAWDDIENGYWPSDFEKNRTKTRPDDFVAFCKALGYEPIITVNSNLAGVHDERNRINPTRVESIRMGADYAARWVEHANVKNKSGVKYWEIGNEVWIWLKESEYPVYVREYASAMRKVDPGIKIIACGLAVDSEFNPVWLNFPDDPEWEPRSVNRTNAEKWTRALLKDAHGSFDYLAPHIYLDGDGVDAVENGVSLFANIECGEQLLRQQIAWIREANSPVRLACTEWMINWHYVPDMKGIFLENKSISKAHFDQLGYENSPTHAFVSLLGCADYLGKMLATGYVDIAVVHTLTFGIGVAWNAEAQKSVVPVVPKPGGAAVEFWSAAKGHRVVPVRLAHVPTYTHRATYQGRDVVVPYVTAYATATDRAVNLVLVNRSPDRTFTVAVPTAIDGRRVVKAVEHAIEADSWAANIWPTVTDGKPYPFRKAQRALDVETLNAYQAKPCRLVRVELELASPATPAGEPEVE
ncbi:MAG: hypothetical protein GXY33_13430 [Phycisphaerae bacterium]|nr:hypothetical protein [Phycisphaerae bacterium]